MKNIKNHQFVMIAKWVMVGNVSFVVQNAMKIMENAQILIVILWIYRKEKK